MKAILVFGILVAFAFPVVQAQEAKVDHITIYKDEKGIVYHNEVFFINEENPPVRINNVMVRPLYTTKSCGVTWLKERFGQ